MCTERVGRQTDPVISIKAANYLTEIHFGERNEGKFIVQYLFQKFLCYFVVGKLNKMSYHILCSKRSLRKVSLA